MSRERWAAELEARARAYWTEARTEALTAGKALPLRPAEAAPLLRALGLLRDDATMPPPQVRKYLQINHMVGLVEPELRALRERHATIRLLDAGCGRSYLTLLLAWCARHVWEHPLEVLGVDRNPEVIEECRRRTALAGLDDVVRFEAIPIEQIEAREIHGVIALHACDTATCDALAVGVRLGAEVLAVAPCCQAELARAWTALVERAADGPFAPIWGAPHLRRETAAHLTDAMRMLLLRAAGYDVRAVELVPSEHTRKNTLIRALRAGAADPVARAQYDALVQATGGAGIQLDRRLP